MIDWKIYQELSPWCNCPPGFDGKNCDHNIDECASNPCTNGATCNDQIDDYRCDCSLGYSGRNCHLIDCYGVYKAGKSLPRTFTLSVDSGTQFEAYYLPDGWTVIQSRGQFNSSDDYFYKNWNEYVQGFGTPGK